MSLLLTGELDVAVGSRRLVQGLNLRVQAGEFWCVLGQNGAGKSTLLYVLAGLLRPAAGSVLIDGRPAGSMLALELARKRGLMPQQHADAFSYTVLETVLTGRTPYRVGRSWDSEEDRQAAITALRQVGLEHKANSDILHLSGGERQRVALAALLAQAPELLLLDEPTSHQDVAHQLALMRLIRGLSRQHAVIASCHDIGLAARFATHALVLAEGRHWSGPAQQVLTAGILQQAFGCRFDIVENAGMRSFIAR